MKSNQNIRKALKQIEKLSTEMDRGMGMDFAMDGSGECGGMIVQGWTKWFDNQLRRVLEENNVSLQRVRETADAWAKRELENGPKQIFISMYSRRQGMYKETDYLDTRWGNLAFTITQSINC
jgi:hypothetical protein